MIFESRRTVRFADCDPAGIVFFPHYFVMLNTQVEQWFDDGLHIPYASVIGERRTGLPTVRLEADFTAISRHGDALVLRLGVHRLGRSSLALRHDVFGGDQLRLRARQTIVCTSLDTHLPQPLPEDLRVAIRPYIESAA